MPSTASSSSEARDPARHIPTRADDPVPMLFWDPFEFVLAISAFGLLMILANPLVGAAVAGFVLWGSKRLKRGAKRGAAQHACWAFGMMADKALSRFPPSHIREFIE
ncbi:MAG: type IV conjugative transfer system protein TraL [Sinobacteraceae bacterium]|nr:type IV conjugative transfer system protein TraL [Nevskiaceae bacterium]